MRAAVPAPKQPLGSHLESSETAISRAYPLSTVFELTLESISTFAVAGLINSEPCIRRIYTLFLHLVNFDIRYSRLRSARGSIDPAVRVVFLLLAAHVGFKAPSQPGAPPIVEAKLEAVGEPPPAQVEEADEHAAKVRNVADAGRRAAQLREKFYPAHEDHKPLGLHGNDHLNVNQPIGKEHGVREQDSVNRAGTSDYGRPHTRSADRRGRGLRFCSPDRGRSVLPYRLGCRGRQRARRPRRAVQLYAFARINLCLPVPRKMVAVLRHQHMRQQSRSRHAARDRTGGRFRLHDFVAARASELRTHRADHFETCRNPFQNLRNIFAQRLHLATAVRTSRFLRQDLPHLARQVRRQRLTHGPSVIRSARRSPRRWRSIRLCCLRRFQFVQPQLQLLDLPLQLLRLPPKLHPSQLRDQQLQALDLGLARSPRFVFRVKFFLLRGERPVLREDHRFQSFVVQRVQIRKGRPHPHRARGMPELFGCARKKRTQKPKPRKKMWIKKAWRFTPPSAARRCAPDAANRSLPAASRAAPASARRCPWSLAAK